MPRGTRRVGEKVPPQPITAEASAEKVHKDTTERIESVVRVYEQQIEALKNEVGELRRLLAESVAEKERAREALEAVRNQVEQLPAKRTDESNVTHLLEEAKESLKRKATKMQELLRNAPRVAVYNHKGYPISLGLNGVTVVMQPGINEIPSPFLEVWQAHLDGERTADERERLIRGAHDMGIVDKWRADGRYEYKVTE